MERDQSEPILQPGELEDDVVMPVIEEEVLAEVVPVKTGSVRVEKHVQKRTRRIQAPLLREEVEVRRVPVNRVVTEAPPVRREGGVTIIPVLQEELVITKRLVLKEEIHLVRHRTTDQFSQEVQLDRESAEVRRLDASGRVVDPPAKQAAHPKPRRGLLG